MKHISIILLTALLLTVAGCKKEMEFHNDTHLANIATSDCLMKTDALAAKDMKLDSIAVTFTDGTLSVTHHNMLLDCGSGDNIVTTMQLMGDTVMVTENVGNQGQVNCLCLYNHSFQIVEPPLGLFTLVIMEECYYLGNLQQRIVYQHQFYL